MQQVGQVNREVGQCKKDFKQSMQQVEIPVNTLHVLPNAIDMNASSTFNFHTDVQTYMFVAMETYDDD
jgi:hypothetical protein